MNLIRGILAGVFCAVLVLGAAAALPLEDNNKTVEITDKAFVPDRLEVTVGQKVTWKNMGIGEHTVTAKDRPADSSKAVQDEKDKPLFDSGPLKPGGTFEHAFTKEGSYDYACMMNKKMWGTIIVKPVK